MDRLTLLIGCVAAVVSLTLSAWMLVLWLHDHGIHPLHEAAKVLPRGFVECMLLASAVIGFLKVGGSKETNGLRGVSAPAPLRELGMENGKWKMENGGVVAVGDSTILHSPLYILHSVATNDSCSFSMPSNGVCCSKWRLRGAAKDRTWLYPPGWSFALGDDSVTNLTAYSTGRVRLPGGLRVSPLPATLGVVPAANWGLLGSNAPSLFWHAVGDDGSLLITWQNVLLHRATTNPVSVQAEFRPSGGVTFRYDLSRLASDDPLSGVVPSAGGVAPDAPLSRGVTSVTFKSRDEAICDEARAAFEEALGGLDPFSFPEGSTNTVLEHLFYSGTTNGAFAYPQATEHTAVLRVTVSGTGTGDLLVGGSYVPLVGGVQRRGAETQSNCLMRPVPDGGRVPVYLKGDGTLSVSFDSGEFAFGELPSIAANRHVGWINFPNTKATEPCVHDFRTRKRVVSLPVGSGAEELSCEWTGGEGVQVENIPPRSATLTASFDARETREIIYTLSHPKPLFGKTQYSQTVRFCPRPPDPDPDDPAPPEDPSWFSEGDPPDEDDVVYLDALASGEPSGAVGDEDEVCPVHEVPYEQCAHLHAADYTNAVQNVDHLGGVLYIRDPPVTGDQICLEVPNEHVDCCGCHDHWTNCVSVAYRSPRISVTGPDGQDFTSAVTSCTVNVAGVRPSRAIGDAGLAFARNGEIYERKDYTVFGVGIRRDGIPLSRYNELNSQFGYPMTVCTNDWRAPTLELVTNVRLPSGTVHIEFADATAPFALWYCRRGESEYRKLLDSERCPSKDIPIAAWRSVVAGVTSGSAASVPVVVTSSAPGTVRLVLRYWTAEGGAFAQDEVFQQITSVKPTLLVDYNRDGRIDAEDVRLYLAGRMFRYWINECKVTGDVWEESSLFLGVADVLVGLDNWRNDHVDGRYDLVNLFPVAVSAEPFLDAWGGSGSVNVKVRCLNGDDVVRFTLADVGHADAGSIRTASRSNIFGQPLHSATMNWLTNSLAISSGRYNASFARNSALLVCEAAKPACLGLLLTVDVDGSEMYSFRLPMAMSTVDNMYRYVSIRGAHENPNMEFSGTNAPPNNPDSELADKDVFFVHGFNVSPENARNWNREMFKRFWVSGMNARYWGVTWDGDYHVLFEEFNGLHYHRDVRQALMTAPTFARLVNSNGVDSVVIGHSLGNMVVSEALLKDMNAKTYIMLDAAVASEAYRPELQADSDEILAKYRPGDWSGYDSLSWAANWYTWFTNTQNDARADLGWAGHFAPLLNREGLSVYNFYSSGDEVFAESTNGTPGLVTGVFHWPTLNHQWPFFHLNLELDAFPWQKQEVFKGVNAAGSFSAGWGFHCWTTNIDEQTVWDIYSAAEANAMVADGSIVTNAVFDRGVSAMFNSTISDYDIADILAFHIPAVSSPAGKVTLRESGIEMDFDLNSPDKRANGWGREGILVMEGNGQQHIETPWLHSDIKNMAYYYVYPAFTNIVEKGEMK